MNEDGNNEFIEFLAVIAVVGGLLTALFTGVTEWVDEQVAALKAESAHSAPAQKAKCKEPIGVDGDTIKLYCKGKKMTVRLYGIDSPEEKRPNTPVQCQAFAAADSMTAMLKGAKHIVLVSDPTQDSTDRYGRSLAYVEADGKDLNRAQVRKGFARVYVYNKKKFQRYKSYHAAEKAAKADNVGVWRHCGGDNHKNP